MKCPRPDCGKEGEVIESRVRPDGLRRRRYQCTSNHRFSTIEQLAARDGQSQGQRLEPIPQEK